MNKFAAPRYKSGVMTRRAPPAPRPSPGGGGGGGALRYQMATHCQTAERCGRAECENIGAVNSFEGKKGGRSAHKNEIHDIPYMKCFMEKFESLLYAILD